MIKKIKTNQVIQKHMGIHLLVEFWDGKIIDSSAKLKKVLIESARKANNTPLEVAIHKFSPQGITGVILLAESHIALHAWPEKKYIGIDIFTCGAKAKPYLALKYFKKVFAPKKYKVQEQKRG